MILQYKLTITKNHTPPMLCKQHNTGKQSFTGNR